MPTELERLEIAVEADPSKLKTDIGTMKKELGGLDTTASGATSKISSHFASMGKSIKTAIVAAGITKFASDCLSLASDLQEVQNVVDVTFGNMSSNVNNFAANTLEKFGLSELAAKQFTGTMGAMLKSSGLTSSQALEMSKTLTALSGDMASFYNLSANDAFAKIRAGISGETEPLKQLGINMSVANLEAYALSQGITRVYSDMSQAEQTLLRYNYLLQTSASAQGDFSRTIDSYANQTKLLSMRFDELKASIGEGLIAILSPVLEVINAVISGISAIANGIKSLLGDSGVDVAASSVTNLADPVEDVSEAFSTTANNAKSTANSIKETTKAAKQLRNELLGFDEMTVLSDNSSTGVGVGGPLGTAVEDALKFNTELAKAYDNLEDMKELELDGVFGSISLSAEQIKTIVGQIIDQGKLKKMAELTNEINEMESLALKFEDAKKELEGYDWMIEMGFQVSEDDYKAAIDKLIITGNEYIAQQHKVVKIAAEIVFGKDSTELKEADKFYSRIEGDLEELSKQIKEKVNSAWEDGIFDLDEQKEIRNLTDQYKTIISDFEKAAATVELSNIKVHYNGVALDEESYKALNAEIDAAYKKIVEGNDKAVSALKIPIQYDFDKGNITKEKFDSEMAKLDVILAEMNAEAATQTLIVKIKAMAQMDFTEVNKKINMDDVVAQLFEDLDPAGKFASQQQVKDAWARIFAGIGSEVRNGISNMDSQTKEALAELLKSLEPETKEYEKLARQYEKEGRKVPEHVSKGLQTAELLKALNGDTASIFYIIGNQLKGTEYEKALKEAQKKGADFPEEMIKGLNSEKINLKNGVNSVLNTVATTLEKSSLEKTAKKEGSATTKAFADGIKTPSGIKLAKSAFQSMAQSGNSEFTKYMNASRYKNYAKNVYEALCKEININGVKYTEGAFRNMAQSGNTAWQKATDTHSPSRLYIKFGRYVGDGLVIGIRDRAKDVRDAVRGWATDMEKEAQGMSTSFTYDTSFSGEAKNLLQRGNISLASGGVVGQLAQAISSQPINVTVQSILDGKVVSRSVVDNVNQQTMTTGVCPIAL